MTRATSSRKWSSYPARCRKNTLQAFAADFFGPKNAGTIYRAMLTAWSAGGIVGPILITSFGTMKNPDYATLLYIIAGLMLVSAALP